MSPSNYSPRWGSSATTRTSASTLVFWRGFCQFDAPACVIGPMNRVLYGSDDTPSIAALWRTALVNAAALGPRAGPP